MKTYRLGLGMLLLLSVAAQAQITVKVDSTKNWAGYVNWFSTNNAYVGGGAWGLADLRAYFLPAKSNATRVVLQLNTNTFNTNGFWNLEDGTPNKHLELNFYVDVGTAYGGQDVTFVGTVESNTIPAGWECYAVIKEFASGYAYLGDDRVLLTPGAFAFTRPIASGHICQYGFLTFGPNARPGSTDALQAASIVVDNADPAITSEPANQRVLVGGTAAFSVAATGGSTLKFQWKRYGTNLVDAAGKFSGVTNATLTISNASASDDTTYTVTVTDNAGSVDSVPARLRVLAPLDFANLLDNPSFELDVTDPVVVPPPWVNFTGSQLQNTNDFYAFTEPVQTKDGTNVVQVYNGGQYSGIFQDVPAVPGEVFTGDGWLWQSRLDPLLAAVHEAFLEVQFWGVVGGGPIAIYQSIKVTNSPPFLDNWLFLQATNGVPSGYAATSTTNANYLVAPPGTVRVRHQITVHAEGAGGGSVYVDSMRLVKKVPVSVTATRSGSNVILSWPSQLLNSYQVVYKEDLATPAWTSLGPVIEGDGAVKSVSYTATGTRFYNVITK